jgi:hypothetical protein
MKKEKNDTNKNYLQVSMCDALCDGKNLANVINYC